MLVAMNQDTDMSSVESLAPPLDSDRSSASPLASVSSAIQDDEISSLEITPPPFEYHHEYKYSTHNQSKTHYRYSSTSSIYSQSYQSTGGRDSIAGSVPTAASYGSTTQFSFHGRRPSASGTQYSHSQVGEDDAGIAAALDLCSFGTPRTGPIHNGDDIPPVPPLPAKFASHKASISVGAANSLYPGFHGPTSRISDERRGPASNEDEHVALTMGRRSVSRGQHDRDEVEEGMFGMEE